MQLIWAGVGDSAHRIVLPDPDEPVIGCVPWGRPEEPMTPAYWAVRCGWEDADKPAFVSEGGSLIEEAAFCLLGGFGITYEVNAAAFERLRRDGAFEPGARFGEADFLARLLQPLDVAGRRIRYRFPNQRARRLAAMIARLDDVDTEGFSALELRDFLLELDGIGPKTASWIVRNIFGTDQVAILDIHVIRACTAMRIFPEQVALPKDYELLERRFLEFASAIQVRASVLDAVMWTEMRAGRSLLAA